MRKPVIVISMATMLMASTSLGRAEITEYPILGMIIEIVNTIKLSALTKEQKDSLLRRVEAWKKLPPTKQNYDYVSNQSGKIRASVAHASNLKSTTKEGHSR
jgi:hypothetical protein